MAPTERASVGVARVSGRSARSAPGAPSARVTPTETPSHRALPPHPGQPQNASSPRETGSWPLLPHPYRPLPLRSRRTSKMSRHTRFILNTNAPIHGISDTGVGSRPSWQPPEGFSPRTLDPGRQFRTALARFLTVRGELGRRAGVARALRSRLTLHRRSPFEARCPGSGPDRAGVGRRGAGLRSLCSLRSRRSLRPRHADRKLLRTGRFPPHPGSLRMHLLQENRILAVTSAPLSTASSPFAANL